MFCCYERPNATNVTPSITGQVVSISLTIYSTEPMSILDLIVSVRAVEAGMHTVITTITKTKGIL